MTSRISTGLQSDISNAFSAGLNTGVNRATLREQTKAAEEKAAILGAAQVREAQIKAQADQMKATLDNAEKHYKQQASYYDDQNTYLQTQLLNNGARYTDEQRQEISRQIEGNLREKSRIMSEGAQILGLPAFTPKASNVSMASEYSPEYVSAQSAEREGKKFDAASSGLKFNAGKNVFEQSGGMTTNYSDTFIPQRLDIQERSLEHNISNDPPAPLLNIFGGKMTANQQNELADEHGKLIDFVNQYKTGRGDDYKDYGPYTLYNNYIIPQYSRIAPVVASNLDPDEQTVVSETGITFRPENWLRDQQALDSYANDPNNPNRKAAGKLRYKLGFGPE